ncbi:MAG: TRAP-type C4-dicarboxylate transport system permease small subunit [Parasphingorhabdus sp.]|jgi:TRAP-type C4-dicarboxylate transport system permease small subunit
MKDESGSPIEWLLPFAFIFCAGWATWHTPAYILDFITPTSQSLLDQISELHQRKDITPDLPGLFGGFADPIDWAVLILMPIIFVFGIRGVRCAAMEYPHWRPIDRVALFVGRITMILIISMTSIMLYEVFLRYVFEAPTLWANELTLWIAGYVFLLSGFYAMQQRCHIRIFLLYDMVPRWLQHLFDIISVTLLWIFAFFLIYGSYKQVFIVKFYKWEMFGTAFDPPIPATVQPMILIMVALISIQAAVNLISDWNIEPGEHTKADDLDKEELEQIKRSVGAS